MSSILQVLNDGNDASKVRSLGRLSVLYLWCVQTDYEQELSLQRTAHKRELARSRDEVAQLLATAEASSVPVDEELVRRRYIKEIERIKVWRAYVLNF